MGGVLFALLALFPPRLLAAVAITVSNDQTKIEKRKKRKRKKENSPLPDALAGYLFICRGGAQLGTDPCSHNAAVLFWLKDGGAPSASRG